MTHQWPQVATMTHFDPLVNLFSHQAPSGLLSAADTVSDCTEDGTGTTVPFTHRDGGRSAQAVGSGRDEDGRHEVVARRSRGSEGFDPTQGTMPPPHVVPGPELVPGAGEDPHLSETNREV